MVEVTLTLVKDVVTIVGVIAGFTYYMITVRNANKTRKTQILSQAYSRLNEESWKRFLELLKMEWTDYDDFENKYGSDNNPDNYAKRMTEFGVYENIGILLKNGLIEPTTLYDLYGGRSSWMWDKFGPIILVQRVQYSIPEFFSNFEYLVKELTEVNKAKGYEVQIPENYTKYIKQ